MTFSAETPITYLITKGEANAGNFAAASAEILETVRLAVAAGISMIQLREKDLLAKHLFDLSVRAANLTRHSKTKLLINDRADVALAAGADGVHLTSRSLSAKAISENFPMGMIIGVSTHTLGEARTAADDGAEFAVFGPVFQTPGKETAAGLGELSRVCSELAGFPILGLGGISALNCESVIRASAHGFAAIRYLNDPDVLRDMAASQK